MGRHWTTPLVKQCFVVAGVSLNMANFGTVMGFNAILLPQLQAPDSDISVDTASASWIASIVGISLVLGNLAVPTIMGKFGRRRASLFSCFILIACWLQISIATNITLLLIARFFQGFSLGINLSLSPIMIGELTSPKHRGIFSAIMTTSITTGTLSVHVMGSYLTWHTTALVCAFVCVTSFAILILSPESPSWLADKKRYEDSRRAFHWLRGDMEEEELEKMLEARKTRHDPNENNKKFTYLIEAFKKKEFYKPVIIMLHLHTISMWTGMCFLIVFTVHIIRLLVGDDIDVAMHLTIIDVQRMLSTFVALYAVKIVKRRRILFTTVGANIVILVVIALYTLAKSKNVLPFDHPAIGLVLLHIHMCTITTGSLPLPVVISGEIFPLEFRSLAGGISSLAFSVNYFITSKTAMFLLSTIGIHGTYFLYASVSFYCTTVVWFMLPETKDRTLHDVEEEFRGKAKIYLEKIDVIQALPLTASEEKNMNI
ncbi:hypothetical protein evm_004713 [Chilo suppressalis]|nr:hypothetical protein evm_004713 [Chilo suppressalis]